jgi:outer membrane protein OmpA-like peptidoglycan-associated protein
MSPCKNILLLAASFAAAHACAQPFRIHASGIYVSDELVYVAPDPQNVGALNRIKGGFKQGLGLEYRRPGKSHSFEILYFGQKTRIEDWHYKEAGLLQKTNLRASFNHLLVSPLQHFRTQGNSDPFMGVMAGVGMASFSNPLNGISSTRPAFSWGLRGGIEMGKKAGLRTRLFANLLWTMKSIGGDFSKSTANPSQPPRYASMIQLQLGASLSLHPRKIERSARVKIPRKAMPKPVADTSSEALYLARRNKLFREITLSGDTLVIRLFDNAIIDNDTVSLFLNGQKYVSRQALRAQPYEFVIPIKQMYDTTDFVMLAESMGFIPPNTAMLRTNYGTEEQYIQMESTDTTSAMIRFLNPGGRPRMQMDLAALERERIRDSTIRMERLMATMDKHADEIRERIPSAEVVRQDTRIKVLFSTGMMFQKNSFEIGVSYKNDLASLKTLWQQFPESRIIIEGHTDDSGPELLNFALSRKRAQVVFDYLQLVGMPVSKMDMIGYGETRPKYPNDTEENRRKNRRVEIIIAPEY